MQIPSDFLREAAHLFGSLGRHFRPRLPKSAGSPSRPCQLSTDILSHVLATFDLHGITLAVTDGDHWLESFRASAPEPGIPCGFLIPTQAMAAACRSDPGSAVGLTPCGTYTRRELRVDTRCGGSRVQSAHPTAAVEAFPACPAFGGTPSMVPASTMEKLSRVATCTSIDPLHQILNGVCFTPTDGGRLVATDGRRIACMPAVVPPRGFVLPNAAVRVLTLPEFRGFENVVTLPDGGNPARVMFRCWDHLLIASLLGGEFPEPTPPNPAGAPSGSATLAVDRRRTVVTWLRRLQDRRNPVKLNCGVPGQLAITQRHHHGTVVALRVPAQLQGQPPEIWVLPRDLADALEIGPTLDLRGAGGPGLCHEPGGGFCLLMPLQGKYAPEPLGGPPWLGDFAAA